MAIKIRKKREIKSDAVDIPIVDQVKDKYVRFKRSIGAIEDAQTAAFDRMYEFGEILLKHREYIMEEYGSWAQFSVAEGLDKYAVSRCHSSVSDFKTHGATSLSEARKLLESRGYKPSAKLMEQNINRILIDVSNEGKKEPPREKSVKREKHTQELMEAQKRVQEIMDQHEPDDDLYEEAKHVAEFIGETFEHLGNIDISKINWTSKLYLDFCRNINYDVVLGKPVDKSEPHHISPKGDQGSMGAKVSDLFAIPVCRDTHNKLHSSDVEFDLLYEEIADFHRWTMIMFIIHTIASDD